MGINELGGDLYSVRKIDLLSEVGEVSDKNLDLFIGNKLIDHETVRYEIDIEEGKLVLVSYVEGGHVQSHADLCKLLEHMAINYPELYMKNVTTNMMRDYI